MNPSELPRDIIRGIDPIALPNLSKMWARFEGRNPVWWFNPKLDEQLRRLLAEDAP